MAKWTIDFRGSRPIRVRKIAAGETQFFSFPNEAEAQQAFAGLKEDNSSRRRRGCRGRQLLF